eukprot:345370-Prymnesium_polylepis.1
MMLWAAGAMVVSAAGAMVVSAAGATVVSADGATVDSADGGGGGSAGLRGTDSFPDAIALVSSSESGPLSRISLRSRTRSPIRENPSAFR